MVCVSVLLASSAWAQEVVVIDDIPAWAHPTKDVLARYGVTLKKVELRNNRVYPVFFVDFPWDPSSGPNGRRMRQLEVELLQANGWHDYALDIEPDQIVIAMHWRKDLKQLDESVEQRRSPSR